MTWNRVALVIGLGIAAGLSVFSVACSNEVSMEVKCDSKGDCSATGKKIFKSDPKAGVASSQGLLGVIDLSTKYQLAATSLTFNVTTKTDKGFTKSATFVAVRGSQRVQPLSAGLTAYVFEPKDKIGLERYVSEVQGKMTNTGDSTLTFGFKITPVKGGPLSLQPDEFKMREFLPATGFQEVTVRVVPPGA